jgi:hypothetical protein
MPLTELRLYLFSYVTRRQSLSQPLDSFKRGADFPVRLPPGDFSLRFVFLHPFVLRKLEVLKRRSDASRATVVRVHQSLIKLDALMQLSLNAKLGIDEQRASGINLRAAALPAPRGAPRL